MNEQRAFTVAVTGCKNCPKRVMINICDVLNSHEHVRQNYSQLTPSCPMWPEAKPLKE